MSTNQWPKLCSVLIFGSLLGIGCAPQSPSTNLPAAPAGVGDSEGGVSQEQEQVETELAKLSANDRAAVVKQQVCPVSGKKLGTMGTPLNIEFQNQSVWICCSACKDELIANFAQHVEKLKSGPQE